MSAWATLIQYSNLIQSSSAEQVEEDKIENEISAAVKLNSKNVVSAGEQQNYTKQLLT